MKPNFIRYMLGLVWFVSQHHNEYMATIETIVLYSSEREAQSMSSLLRTLTASVYRHVAKPLMFRQSPDSVHTYTVKVGELVQKSAILRGLIHWAWAYQNEPVLAQDIAGLHFKNPVGLSAGFDKNIQLAPLMRAIGFGFMAGGSITNRYCAGNPRPWFHRLPKEKSLVVNAGLANDGAWPILKRLRQAKRPADLPLNISVARTNDAKTVRDEDGIKDYLDCLKRLGNIPEMIEINISCPNTYGGEPINKPVKLNRLLKGVDELSLRAPIFVKMPSDLAWPEFQKLLEVIIKHQIIGVTISNLQKIRTGIDIDPTIKGNLSGKPVEAASNQLIRQTYKKYGKRLVIIGVGGIFSAEDAYQKIKFGASLVGLITGIIYQGPQLIGEVNCKLVELLAQDGFNNIQDAIGSEA